MAETMWMSLVLVVVCWGFCVQESKAQATGSLTGIEGHDVTLSCSLTGTFQYPAWLGPPNLLPYTNEGIATINSNAPAAADNRLNYASNNKSLVLSNAQKNDSGDYKCSFTSLGDYTVTLTVSAQDCKCECECKCGIFAGLSMAFGILGASGLLIAFGGICIECFDEMKKQKTLLLASCVIGIVCDLLSLVFSIVVKVIGCCEENCEDSCCKDDSECCKEDSKCCDDWIVNSAIAFIVIPCLAVVVSVVIFILVKLDKIGPGNNAYKAKEAKEPGENHGMTGTSM